MRICKIFFVVILLIASIGIKAFYSDAKINSEKVYFYNGKENLQCLYYDETDFINVKNFEMKNLGIIQGCILPHHLTASDLIHEVFQNVSKTNYDTVVLIGPDHESIQKGKVFTTTKDYQTPFGILDTNEKITEKLLKYNFVLDDDEKLTMEHSTSGIVPFIKYYLSDVNVVTLVITKQTKIENVDKLIEGLCANVDKEKTLVIASVDFSHYLDLDNAEQMDLITMDTIKNKDINKIMTFDNKYLDSPISIATLLKFMDKLNAGNIQLLNHSNTELIMRTKMEETTSYLTYLFY